MNKNIFLHCALRDIFAFFMICQQQEVIAKKFLEHANSR